MTSPATPTPASPPRVILDTHQKALAVNLDLTSFGSFAEIGAGQEVARWFLNVGAASGTVAKTVSAYDKEVSDDLYGSGTRYVSRQRLEAMLDGEWRALLHQVGKQRGLTTRLFAFADTIAALNFARNNDCHGWIGIRFQDRPGAEPSDVLLHLNLRNRANILQQEVVGILGVNLVHALLAESHPTSAADLPARLFDNIADGRIELDQIEMRGPAFAGYDTHALHVNLARDGRAEAVTFGADGVAVAANEFLYKKAVVLAPAAADPRDDLSPEAVAACVETLRRETTGNAAVKDVIDLRLWFVAADTTPPAASATAAGPAMLTRHEFLHRSTDFVRRYTQAPLRFAMTVPTVMGIFDRVGAEHLDGRLLEAIARLFASDVRVLAYPSRPEDVQRQLGGKTGHQWAADGAGPWLTADQVRPASPLRHLYEYLLASGFLVAMPAR